MRRSSQSGSDDWVYSRFESARVLIDFRRVTIVDPNESSGDEPYLWPFIIKLDGDTVSMLSAPRNPNNYQLTVLSSSGSQNNLTARENLPAGTVLTIPREIGHFETTVRTALGVLPRTVASDALSQLIVLGIVWEEDGFVPSAVDAAYRQAGESIASRGKPLIERAVNQAIFQIITGRDLEFDTNALINELVRQVRDDAESAGLSAGGLGGLFSLIFGSPDDFLGRATLRLPFTILTANSAMDTVTIPFTFNLLFPPPGGVILGTSPLSDDRSNYTLEGTVIVEPSGQLI